VALESDQPSCLTPGRGGIAERAPCPCDCDLNLEFVHCRIFAPDRAQPNGLRSNLGSRHLYARAMSAGQTSVLRQPVPGPLFNWVKRASYVELALFTALIVVWVAPGAEHATALLGLAHGLGFVGLALLIWVAVVRHEAPYTLLAATLTPVGPVGSVIAIHYIERGRRSARGGPSGTRAALK
jgi:multisubunit Na+/H+ antiporter MnhF subunit